MTGQVDRRGLIGILALAAADTPRAATGADARPSGSSIVLPSLADLEASALDAAVTVAACLGRIRPGDGGAAVWVRGGPGTGVSVTSRDGAFWRLALMDRIDPRALGASGDGKTDDTEALQAAIDLAGRLGAPVEIPAGHFRITRPLLLESGMTLRGRGAASVILPDMAGLQAALIAPAESNFVHIEGLLIEGGIDVAGFTAGTLSARQVVGIKIGAGDRGGNRFLLRDVRVRGLAVAFDLSGWCAEASNCWANYCGLGLNGLELNGTELHFRFENNRKDFAIRRSDGVAFTQLLCEGEHVAAEASTLDDCRAVSITGAYFEQVEQRPRREPFLRIGQTGPCSRIAITEARFSDYLEPQIPFVDVDRCDGLTITGYYSRNGGGRVIATSARTVNYACDLASMFPGPLLQDDSGQLAAAWNYFPNRSFELWFRGWDRVSASGLSLVRETLLVRRGRNALRLERAGAAGGEAFFHLHGATVEALAGRMIRAAAWIHAPAGSNPGRAGPALVLKCRDAAGRDIASASQNRIAPGTWTLASVDVMAPASSAGILIGIAWPAGDGPTQAVIDSIVLCEAAVPMRRIVDDQLADSPCIGAQGLGGRLLQSAPRPPSDPLQIYAPGDQVANPAPAPGQAVGWVCVVGGPGGQANFRPFATVG